MNTRCGRVTAACVTGINQVVRSMQRRQSGVYPVCCVVPWVPSDILGCWLENTGLWQNSYAFFLSLFAVALALLLYFNCVTVSVKLTRIYTRATLYLDLYGF